ncbi:early nodulin-like protein 1 [Rhodamnia argentea]|uniref:Early nodulin-like protein 1 n=1 Tax=Rhodamnia argentea TaxID=178133 RepID=A0A8B8P3L4_9MYRT|nr:early nodulin-like protein 1 [Rhodamnia argentea]
MHIYFAPVAKKSKRKPQNMAKQQKRHLHSLQSSCSHWPTKTPLFVELRSHAKPKRKREFGLFLAELLVCSTSSMAIPLLRLDRQMKRVFRVMVVLLWVTMLARRSEEYEFTVGDAQGWTVPANSSAKALNRWAERSRFQIGDSLVFVYPPGQDSVLYVNHDDYNNCNDGSPMEKYVDGHTVFKFNHSGPFYFISGNKDNCHKNEKLEVVVMADRSNKTSSTVSPPPSGNNGTAPSPAPSGEESPPSPAGMAPAPASQTKKSGAASVFVGFTGSIGAFVASSLLLTF